MHILLLGNVRQINPGKLFLIGQPGGVIAGRNRGQFCGERVGVPSGVVTPQSGSQRFLFSGQNGQPLAVFVAAGLLGRFPSDQRFQNLAAFVHVRLETGQHGAGWRIADGVGMSGRAADRAG